MNRLTDIIEDIDWFEEQCQEEDYTDTGEAWELLNLIRTRLKAEMGYKDDE